MRKQKHISAVDMLEGVLFATSRFRISNILCQHFSCCQKRLLNGYVLRSKQNTTSVEIEMLNTPMHSIIPLAIKLCIFSRTGQNGFPTNKAYKSIPFTNFRNDNRTLNEHTRPTRMTGSGGGGGGTGVAISVGGVYAIGFDYETE